MIILIKLDDKQRKQSHLQDADGMNAANFPILGDLELGLAASQLSLATPAETANASI